MSDRTLNYVMAGILGGTALFVGAAIIISNLGIWTVLAWVVLLGGTALLWRYRVQFVDASRRAMLLHRARRAQADREDIDRRNRTISDARNKEIRELQRYDHADKMLSLGPEGFEEFVMRYFRLCGYDAERTGGVADGGIDGRLRRDGQVFFVQCKRFAGQSIGEPVIRDFLGAVTKAGAAGGYFVTTTTFAGGAYRFANGTLIQLIDGERFAELIMALRIEDPELRQSESPGVTVRTADR